MATPWPAQTSRAAAEPPAGSGGAPGSATKVQSVNALVEGAAGLLRHTLDPRVEFQVELGAGVGDVAVERAVLSQIVMSLVLQAHEAVLARLRQAPTGWSPQLQLRTDTCVAQRTGAPSGEGARTWLRVVIEHHGAEHADTAGGSRRAEELVTAAGGWIERGPAAANGTTVAVHLPPATATPEASSPAQAEPPAPTRSDRGGRRRILLAEDTPLVAATLTRVLEHAGHQVTVVTNGEDAWRVLTDPAAVIDLTLADLNMPLVSGRELLERRRSLERCGPIVILTGEATPAEVAELERSGAVAVWRKPLGAAEIIAAIRQVLEVTPPCHRPAAGEAGRR